MRSVPPRSARLHGRVQFESARRSVERGALNRGLGEAWDAARRALLDRDEQTLREVIDLVSGIEGRLTRQRRTDAQQLVAYCTHLLDDLAAGWQPRTPLDRLFGRMARDDVKRCPDCAETVLAAARVCRCCGYRFDSGGVSGSGNRDEGPRDD